MYDQKIIVIYKVHELRMFDFLIFSCYVGTNVCSGISRLREGREDVNESGRSGRPSTSTTNKNIDFA